MSQNLFDKENSSRFANYLFTSAEYDLARPEFERLVFMDSADLDSRIKLIRTYRFTREYSSGVRRIHQMYPALNHGLPGEISLEYGRLLIADNQLEQASMFLHTTCSLSRKTSLFLETSLALYKQEWATANSLLLKASGDEKYTVPYLNIVQEAQSIRLKKPWLSAGLSAIVPGTGKIYSGYWKDGLMSFLFTSVAIWQSYRGFNKSGISSVYGWAYGAMGAGFYIGNIYGSIKAAHKYNKVILHKIKHQVDEVFYNY